MMKWFPKLLIVAVVLSLCVAAVGAAGMGHGHHRQANDGQATCLQTDCPYCQGNQADCPYCHGDGVQYQGRGGCHGQGDCVRDLDRDGLCDYRALCTGAGGGWCR